jgi:hypothetical protein
MNWGWKIALLYGSFVVMMLTLVFLCTQQEIPLVTENYYEKDLNYEEHIQREANSRTLTTDIQVKYNAQSQLVTLIFPNNFEQFEGDVLVFRPSAEGEDFTLPIAVNEKKEMVFGASEMRKGFWKLKINWQGDEMIFYKEAAVVVM